MQMITYMACLADLKFRCRSSTNMSHTCRHTREHHRYGLKTVLSKSCLIIATIIKNMKEAAKPASEESGNADDFNMLAVQK